MIFHDGRVRWHLLQRKFVGILVTNACNLACGGCQQLCGQIPKERIWHIGVEELRTLIGAIRATRPPHHRNPMIEIYGGEPTVHPRWDALLEVLYSFPDQRFQVTTNGRTTVYPRLNVSYYLAPKNPGQAMEHAEFVPTLVAAEDLVPGRPPGFYWELARRTCPLWVTTGCLVYRGKGYYCVVAGAMDNLTGGTHGWEPEPGKYLFDRTDDEVAEQASHFCRRCGWCRVGHHPNQPITDPYWVSPANRDLPLKRPGLVSLRDYRVRGSSGPSSPCE